jgi:hypothetical protein
VSLEASPTKRDARHGRFDDLQVIETTRPRASPRADAQPSSDHSKPDPKLTAPAAISRHRSLSRGKVPGSKRTRASRLPTPLPLLPSRTRSAQIARDPPTTEPITATTPADPNYEPTGKPIIASSEARRRSRQPQLPTRTRAPPRPHNDCDDRRSPQSHRNRARDPPTTEPITATTPADPNYEPTGKPIIASSEARRRSRQPQLPTRTRAPPRPHNDCDDRRSPQSHRTQHQRRPSPDGRPLSLPSAVGRSAAAHGARVSFGVIAPTARAVRQRLDGAVSVDQRPRPPDKPPTSKPTKR